MYIETKCLVLKPFSEADDKVLAALLRDEQIKKTYMLPDFENEEQAMGLARRLRELSLDKSRCVAGIYLNRELIGFFNDVEIKDGTMELGYVVAPNHWGRGYATEMLTALLEHLLGSGCREVITGAFEENTASIRVMEKAGMTRLDKEDRIEYRGREHRCVYYAMK